MIRSLICAAALLALAGCSSVQLDESLKAGTTQAEAQARAGGSAPVTVGHADASIYFAFDSYVIDSQYLPVIEASARRILARPDSNVVVEGNTDSRGSREYNLALGQKRSEAVKQRLQLLGVPAQRIEAVSFGRERPIAFGDNEQDWAMNRRADIVNR